MFAQPLCCCAALSLLLWLVLSCQAPLRVLVVGLDGVGKTSMIYALMPKIVTSTPVLSSYTQDTEYRGLQLVSWDMGGQDKVSNDSTPRHDHDQRLDERRNAMRQ